MALHLCDENQTTTKICYGVHSVYRPMSGSMSDTAAHTWVEARVNPLCPTSSEGLIQDADCAFPLAFSTYIRRSEVQTQVKKNARNHTIVTTYIHTTFQHLWLIFSNHLSRYGYHSTTVHPRLTRTVTIACASSTSTYFSGESSCSTRGSG